MNTIAVLTITPSDELLEFYSGFVRLGYRVIIIIDDNNFKLNDAHLKVKNTGLSLIQIEERECRSPGTFNFLASARKRGGCAAWDKALYYFCCRDLSSDNVWLIEDDVFIPSHKIIVTIDRKYGHADIISADNIVNRHGALDDGWPWWRLVPKTIVPPPWAHSMVCAVRLSRNMLAALNCFIRTNNNRLRFINTIISMIKVTGLLRHKSLWRKRLYIEYIFHTLTLHNQLTVIKAQELSGVVYRNEWNVSTMNSGTIYHPLKDSDLHYRYRKILNQDSTK